MAEILTSNQLTDFLRSLRAVREFASRSIPDEVVQDILEVARWSGSAGNQQSSEIVVIRKQETLARLAKVGGYVQYLGRAAMAMVLVMPGKWAEGEAFDEGRLAERILLAAHAHGVGGSIGWFRDAGRDQAKRILQVPAERMVRTVISMGYSPGESRRGSRKPISELVHEERYSNKG